MFRTSATGNRVAVGTIALVGLLAASTTFAAEVFPPSVIALNQKPDGKSVSITYAYFPQKGTLAIYESDARGGKGRTRLGQVQIGAGDHRDVKIALKAAPRPGAKLWAAVEHKNGNLFKNQGQPAEQSFKVL